MLKAHLPVLLKEVPGELRQLVEVFELANFLPQRIHFESLGQWLRD